MLSSFASRCMASVVRPGIGSARSKRSLCCDLQKYGELKQLLQAHDLRALSGRLADQPFGALQVRSDVRVA